MFGDETLLCLDDGVKTLECLLFDRSIMSRRSNAAHVGRGRGENPREFSARRPR